MVNKLYRIYFPTIDLDGNGFSCDREISGKELAEMEVKKFNETNNDINALMHNQEFEKKEYSTLEGISVGSGIDKVNYLPFEALVVGPNNSFVDKRYMDGFVESGKMCVLFVNARIDNMNPDVCGELKFWLKDSDNILNDKTIDNKGKLSVLPVTDLKIQVDGNLYYLNRCKVIERRDLNVTPFHFVLLAEKIINNC